MAEWKDIRWFYEVVKSGSFSAAARNNCTTQATISRRIKSLEEDLGQDLFIRCLDGCELTEVGKKLESTAKKMSEAYEDFLKESLEISSGVQTIVLTCGALIGMHLSKNIGKLYEGLENVEIEIRSTNKFLNLEKGEADLALRNKRPIKGLLKSKKLKSAQYGKFSVFGPSKYYKNNQIKSIKDLKNEKWISLAKSIKDMPSAKWIEKNIGDRAVRFRMNSTTLILEAIEQNKALAVLPRFIGINSTELNEVYGPIKGLEFEMWLVRKESSDKDKKLLRLMKNIENIF